MPSRPDAVVEAIDLADPALFAGGGPDRAYAELLRRGAVHRNECRDGSWFWAVVRHSDIVRAYGDAATFSSVNGIRLGSDPEAVGRAAQRMLIVSDPPVHSALRRIVGSTLTPAVLRRLDADLKRHVTELIDRTLELREFDVVSEIAARIPEAVICGLLGVPEADRRELLELTTRAFESPDDMARAGANADIFMYFDDLVSLRQRRPGTDVVSQLLAAGLDPDDVVLNCNGLLSGGNETTRHALAGAVLAFAEFPDQLAALRANPDVATAVEEILRWTTPAVYVLRTVTRPTEVSGVTMAAGDQVALWNAAGNRDPEVFADPFRFDLSRSPNRHLAFGHGRHTCIGARLARLEIAAFLAELCRRVAGVIVTQPPVWNGSNFARGLSRLIVRWEAD